MTKFELFKGMNGIDDEALERSEISVLGEPTHRVTAKKKTWAKWGAMAACLCLVVAGAVIPVIKSGTTDTPPVAEELPPVIDEGPAGLEIITPEKVEIIELNGVDYFICRNDSKDILQKYGISDEVTEDTAGVHVCYLEIREDHFIPVEKADASEENDIELFEYAPQPNDNVYIVRIEGSYYAAIRKDSEGYHGLIE